MKRGIYLLANDQVLDNTLALINSIRFFDPYASIIMIPYDCHDVRITTILREKYGIPKYRNDSLLNRIDLKIKEFFGKKFFTRPNQFRKQACWFGPFDEFLYLDTDIVVFERIINNLEHLKNKDFVFCDYQHKNGIKYLFNPPIKNALEKEDLKFVFNAGFWGSRKELITERKLYGALEECAKNMNFFDFSAKVTDMPIFNYLVLRKIKKRINLVRDLERKGPGNWAGMDHFIRKGNRLFDPNVKQYLKYLHWAGINIQKGCPYYDVWNYYRRLNK